MTDQLDRNIEIPKKRIPWLKYFFQFALPAFLVSIKTSAQKTQGQLRMKAAETDTVKVPFPEQIIVTMGSAVARPICNKPRKGDVKLTPVKKTFLDKTVKADTELLPEVIITTGTGIYCDRKTIGIIAIAMPDQIVKVKTSEIKGKVVNEKGIPVPFATIRIKGTNTGKYTDENGLFSLKPPGNHDTITLVASCVGFMASEIIVTKKSYSDTIIIQLLPPQNSLLMGELVVSRKPAIKKELQHVPLIPDIAVDKDAIAFKVFPNPVESGSSLNIEIIKAEEGYYYFQLLNQSGQSVHQREIWIDAEAGLLDLDLPRVAAGDYFLVLTNKRSGKKYTEKILIQ